MLTCFAERLKLLETWRMQIENIKEILLDIVVDCDTFPPAAIKTETLPTKPNPPLKPSLVPSATPSATPLPPSATKSTTKGKIICISTEW